MKSKSTKPKFDWIQRVGKIGLLLTAFGARQRYRTEGQVTFKLNLERILNCCISKNQDESKLRAKSHKRSLEIARNFDRVVPTEQ